MPRLKVLAGLAIVRSLAQWSPGFSKRPEIEHLLLVHFLQRSAKKGN